MSAYISLVVERQASTDTFENQQCQNDPPVLKEKNSQVNKTKNTCIRSIFQRMYELLNFFQLYVLKKM